MSEVSHRVSIPSSVGLDKTAEARTKNKQIHKQGKNRSTRQPTAIDFLGFDIYPLCASMF